MKTDFPGLTNKEAGDKLKEYGYNEIRELLRVSSFGILLRQIKENFMIYLLFAAAVISFFIGKSVTGYAISGIIILLITLGFFQEYKAEKAVKALKQMIRPISVVIRDGKEKEISSRELVPGDLLILRNGEKIPADCVVLEEKELKINESVLTGESMEIKKFAAKNEKDYAKDNLIFMGTFITNGKCIAKILHTGMNTEFGKIAGMISKAEKELPLQKKVNNIAKVMAFVAISVSFLTGAIMLIRSVPFSYTLLAEVLIVVIALCISAFPEGLPVVLISTLASGAYKMAKKNAIVNRMSIIETLGETTVICADKTGTITKGEMTAKKIFANDKLYSISGVGYDAKGHFLHDGKKVEKIPKSELGLILKTAVLCNDSKIERRATDHEYDIKGSPTEGALLIMGAKGGVFREDIQYTREEEIPFSSEKKRMIVLCAEKEGKYIYSKGAPEVLIDKCKFVKKGNRIVALDKKEKEKIMEMNKKLALKRFRVLALAYKEVKSFEKTNFEKDLVFLGLVALDDPPRTEVKPAIESCKEAGIKVKMITGDNKETAYEIGKQIGITGEVLTGPELDKLTDDELIKTVNKISIFARVRPEHKIRIVKALKNNNEIVTMTGDGVNDAPALKEAHIGVAMGLNGTDVSRESADLILKDDNFATIVSAVKEGRTIFTNIQTVVTYMLSCNYAELFVIFFGILFGLPLPLLALQILFLNVVTDDMPAITLGFNSSPKGIMKSKPRKVSGIMNKPQIMFLAIAGLIMGLGSLSVYYFTLIILGQEVVVARTTVLITLIFFEIANAFSFRSFKELVCTTSPFANKYLVYASAASVLAALLIIYTPLNAVFETAPLGWFNLGIAFLTSLSVIIIFDILKLINRKRKIF